MEDGLHAYRGDTIAAQLYVRLFTARTRDIDESWNTTDVYSSYWRLYVNESPGARITLPGGVTHELVPEAVHLIPAWMRFSCSATGTIRHHYAHFELVGLAPQVSRAVFAAPIRVEPPVCELAQGFGRSAEDGASLGDGLRTKAACYGALAEAIEALPAARLAVLSRHGLAREQVDRALDHMDRHLGDDLRITDIAGLCGYSADHFIRRFRRAIGQTPSAYLTERRVATASQLLVFTDLTIDEIAERVGYRNRYYFTRVFARTMGTPPARYRRVEV